MSPKNKLRALCLPCDKVLSLCTAPKISFFEGPVPTPGISSPGSITIPELNQHRATSHTQTTTHMYLLFMGRLSQALAFPSGVEPECLTAALAPPKPAPGIPRGGGCWMLGAYFPAIVPKAGCKFGTPLLLVLRWALELPIKGNVPRGRFALQD